MSSTFDGWTTRKGIHGLPLSGRQADLANIAWGIRLARAPPGTSVSDLREDFWVDLSQNAHREPWGKLGCVTTESCWYSFQHDLCLSGLDSTRSHGIPRGQTPATLFTNADLKSLGGEAFQCASIGLVSAAFWLNPWAPWWRRGDSQSSGAAV